MANLQLEKKSQKTMILLGAGASRPAGILTISEMTESFLTNPLKLRDTFVGKDLTSDERNKLKQIFQSLSDITSDYHGKNDLEYMMTFLGQLEDPKFRDYLKSKYPELKHILSFKDTSDDLVAVEAYQTMIRENIRHFCENIVDPKYLLNLDGLVSKPINIFTLNYDGIIEHYCEKNNLAYTDGFDPFWNPTKFEDENDVNLFKLHGSLYWIRPNLGKPFRVPLSGINMSQVRSIGGHPVNEMMLYPKLQKDKQSEVFSWLDRRFKDSLNNAQICVVIGYSFRDDEIKNSVIESLSANHNLWLIIVNPHASSQKDGLSFDRADLKKKIISMDINVEQALSEKDLHLILQRLPSVIDMESRTIQSQKTIKTRLDQEWTHIITSYLTIKHHDRVRWLVELLYEQPFSQTDTNFPSCIEGVVCPHSLEYMIRYRRVDKSKFEIWKKIFVESYLSLECKFFDNSNLAELVNYNPIKRNERPFYLMDGGIEVFTKIIETRAKLDAFCIANPESVSELQPSLGKIIETLDFIITVGRHSIINRKPQETIDGYEQKDLGLKKWATELVNSLN